MSRLFASGSQKYLSFSFSIMSIESVMPSNRLLLCRVPLNTESFTEKSSGVLCKADWLFIAISSQSRMVTARGDHGAQLSPDYTRGREGGPGERSSGCFSPSRAAAS